MHSLLSSPPFSAVEPVTEVLHGVEVVDPYRWLEDQESPRTRRWLEEQTVFARGYLDSIPGRDRICERIKEFLEIETFDSLLAADGRYVFRKRLPHQEQSCIYLREQAAGSDHLMVDPQVVGRNIFCAVTPLAISPDGTVLVYEVKEGGERASRLEIFDIRTRTYFSEVMPRGLLRGFAFASDSRSFFYSHDPIGEHQVGKRAVYQHRLGTPVKEDVVIFETSGETDVRLGVVAGDTFLIVLVHHLGECRKTECYLRSYDLRFPPRLILTSRYAVVPQIVNDHIFALTDLDAPNYRIVEVCVKSEKGSELVYIVPAGTGTIRQWLVSESSISVLYWEDGSFSIKVVDFSGSLRQQIRFDESETIRLLAVDRIREELFFKVESFFDSPAIDRYALRSNRRTTFVPSATSLNRQRYTYRQVSYAAKDGTRIPMYLVGDREVLNRTDNPAVLTTYGGFRHIMTPQFSVLVSFLTEKGCVFALPSVRGGGEFGEEWHLAGKKHHRQVVFDDFIAGAQWLVNSGIARRNRVAIFGGSNSGLLVGAALTQAPHLFSAAILNAPLLDMIRYHLFNGAIKWSHEFGSADNPQDFPALLGYSPYHRVTDDTAYPAVLMISGDSDQNCNPMHARKMVARLQAANRSLRPIVLDYNPYRGHSPVLPLSVRVNALTDRVAFLCDQLELAV